MSQQAVADPKKVLSLLQRDSNSNKEQLYTQLVSLLKSNDAETCQFVVKELQQFLDVVIKDIDNDVLYVDFILYANIT
jgi:hypothetical protein